MFDSKFLSFACAAQMLLIYSAICQCVKPMCNLGNSKRTTFCGKRVRFALQKGSFCVSVSAMLVYTRQKNIAQVFILERYFFVSIYPAAIPGTYLAMFLVAVLQLC